MKRFNTMLKKEGNTKYTNNLKVEKALIENFISLQKVLTNLSTNFNNLSNKISKLLDLFEISAKSLAEKNFDFGKGGKSEKEIKEKLDELLNQNKTIAKGLALIHEEASGTPPLPKTTETAPKPIEVPEKKIADMDGYQKSISAKKMTED